MAWKNNLRKASFRDVEFFFEEAGVDNACRRVETHQFPFRDTPYSEDLGRSAESFPIEAYVVGDDYMEKRNALRKACETEGAGELIHPYYGSIQVICSGCSIRESSNEGRIARFSLSFIEAGGKDYPGETRDRSAAVTEAAENLKMSAVEDFSKDFTADGYPEFVGFEAVAEIDKFLNLVGCVISDISALIKKPKALASQIQTQISWSAEKAASTKPTVSQAVNSITELAGYGERLNSGSNSRMTQRTEANHNAIVDIIRQTAVAEAAEAASAAEFDNRKEATNARDNIVGAIDRAAENTDSMETYLQLTNLRAELTEAVPQSGLPELITRMIQNPQPSLVLAYEIYGDAKFADEIVQRNGIRHPGFICGEVEVLSEVST